MRALIESTVNAVLKRAESDTRRCVRNTIELAFNNSHGRFQRSLFAAAQRMLQNDDSAYYSLAERVVSDVDHNILKKFGINLGYNGCTCGASKIRSNEEKLGFNIPWSIYIHAQKSDGSFVRKVSEIISQGMQLGVYVYFIFGSASINADFREIYHRFDECAFVTLCDAALINQELVASFEGLNNVMLSINSDKSDNLKSACDILRASKRLYCIHEYYQQYADDMFNVEKLSFYEDTGAFFICTIPTPDCSEKAKKQIKENVLDIRFGQKHPYFAVDFSADMTEIDHIISDDTCWVAFDEDGTVFSSTGTYFGNYYSIDSNSLENILRKVTPPKSLSEN